MTVRIQTVTVPSFGTEGAQCAPDGPLYWDREADISRCHGPKIRDTYIFTTGCAGEGAQSKQDARSRASTKRRSERASCDGGA